MRRGAIVDSIKMLGRVAAQREADLYFASAGRLKSVAAQVGQTVTSGQLLAEMDTGDLKERIAATQVTLETAQVKLQQAGAKRVRDAEQRKTDVATAELAVRQAEGTLAKVESDLVAVQAGPSPVETAESAVREAQQAADAARRNYALVEKSYAVNANISDRENERNWYENNYATYKQRFARGEIDQAELDRHYANVLVARDRYERAKSDAATALTQAQTTVTQADEKLRKAQADRDAKKALPIDHHIAEAERLVATARLNLDKARADLLLKQTATDDDFELKLLQKDIDRARSALDDLKAQMDRSRLTSPFAGKVVAVRGKMGDQLAAYQVVVSLADPTDLEVRGDLIDSDLPRVALNQEVAVTVDTLPGATLKGSIVSLPTGLSSQTSNAPDRTVRVRVEWPQSGAQLGTLARATITVQKKEDALIVPARALKTVGKRRFVEYYDGTMRRSQNVEVGIVTETEVEILSGLTEGQTILAGQ